MIIVKKFIKFFLSVINKNNFFEITIKKKYRFSKYNASHLSYLIEKIPQLKKLDLIDSSYSNNQLNSLVYKFFLRIIPFLNKKSFNVFMRNELKQLSDDIRFFKFKDVNLYKKIKYIPHENL